jgi:hypothetical protein
MIENMLTVGNQVIILFVLIAVGFICRKVKLLDDRAIKGFTDFVLYIVSPCVIINSYSRDFDTTMLKGLIITVCAAALSFAANILLTNLVHDKDKKRENVLRFGVVFSNCGYMSLPLQSALLGDDGVFYGATYIAIFNVVLWTYGVLAMSGDRKNISGRKIVLNPGILGTIAGFFIFLLSIKLPSVILEPVKYLAALNTPIPMIIIGYRLAGSKIKLSGAGVYITMFLRLIVSPAIMILGLYFAGVKGAIAVALTIAASAPCAATATMFAEKFDKDTDLSAAMVSVTTILSIITMPLMVGIATMIN